MFPLYKTPDPVPIATPSTKVEVGTGLFWDLETGREVAEKGKVCNEDRPDWRGVGVVG